MSHDTTNTNDMIDDPLAGRSDEERQWAAESIQRRLDFEDDPMYSRLDYGDGNKEEYRLIRERLPDGVILERVYCIFGNLTSYSELEQPAKFHFVFNTCIYIWPLNEDIREGLRRRCGWDTWRRGSCMILIVAEFIERWFENGMAHRFDDYYELLIEQNEVFRL